MIISVNYFDRNLFNDINKSSRVCSFERLFIILITLTYIRSQVCFILRYFNRFIAIAYIAIYNRSHSLNSDITLWYHGINQTQPGMSAEPLPVLIQYSHDHIPGGGGGGVTHHTTCYAPAFKKSVERGLFLDIRSSKGVVDVSPEKGVFFPLYRHLGVLFRKVGFEGFWSLSTF